MLDSLGQQCDLHLRRADVRIACRELSDDIGFRGLCDGVRLIHVFFRSFLLIVNRVVFISALIIR